MSRLKDKHESLRPLIVWLRLTELAWISYWLLRTGATADAYVLSFSKALARELAGTGVSVTALCPGLADSSFEARSGAGRTFLYKVLPKMSAAAVAHAGYAGLKRGAAVVLPGALTKLLAFAGELPPRRIAVEVNRLLLLEARSGGDAPTDKQSVRPT